MWYVQVCEHFSFLFAHVDLHFLCFSNHVFPKLLENKSFMVEVSSESISKCVENHRFPHANQRPSFYTVKTNTNSMQINDRHFIL